MWVKLSREEALRRRFIEAASPACTIMYSISSLIELALIREPAQQIAITEVMDSVDFGFIDHDANSVIKREKEHETELGSGIFSSRHPASDREILDYLVREHYPNTDPKMSLLYKQVVASSGEIFRKMEEDLASSMSRLLKSLRHEPDARAIAKKKESFTKSRATRAPIHRGRTKRIH